MKTPEEWDGVYRTIEDLPPNVQESLARKVRCPGCGREWREHEIEHDPDRGIFYFNCPRGKA